MKVVVTGGRTYKDAKRVAEVLGSLEITTLAQGGARGADELARDWAIANGIPVKTYEADWTTFGPSAGPRRNESMLDAECPDLVVAFPGNRGTMDCVTRAKRKGLRIMEVSDE